MVGASIQQRQETSAADPPKLILLRLPYRLLPSRWSSQVTCGVRHTRTAPAPAYSTARASSALTSPGHRR